MKDKFTELAWDFMNESIREEEADEERINLLEAEENHFEEDEN